MSNFVELVCPPERHIPVAFQEVYEVLKKRLTKVKDAYDFERISALVESISSLEFHEMRERLQFSFKGFSAGAKGQVLQTRVGKSLPSRADLEQQEQAMITDFLKLMNKAHFKLLKKEEWESAVAEEFTFTMPVEVNFSALDDKMLSTFWKSSPENVRTRSKLPDISDRILMFHRGVGLAHQRDWFFMEKVDILLEYIVGNPATAAWHAVCNVFAKKQPTEAPVDEPASNGSAFTRVETTHKNRKTVQRQTLRMVMPSVGAVLSKLFKKVDIQEPTFKEVVILYRKVIPQPKKKKHAMVKQTSDAQRLKNILQRRNIVVKSFGETPMADIELIFPEKTVHIKIQDKIQLLVMLVSAIVASILTLFKSAVTLSVVWSALSTFAVALGQMYSNMQTKKANMSQSMSLQLYNVTNDSQEGVLCYLLEEMAEQQLKEALIAYTLLLVHQQAVSKDELDEMCETFLTDNFDLRLDFAIEDSLPRLKQWGMVQPAQQQRTGDIVYRAVSLPDALAALQNKWTNFYNTTSQTGYESPLIPAGAAISKVKPEWDEEGASMVSDISYQAGAFPKKRKGLKALFSRKKL